MRRAPSLVVRVAGSRRHTAQPREDARGSRTRRQSAANRVRNLPGCWTLADRAALRRTTPAIHSDCLTRILWKRYIRTRSPRLGQSRPSAPHPGLQNTRVRFLQSMFVPPGAGLRATQRVSKLQRLCRGFREEPSELQWVGLQDRSLPLDLRENDFARALRTASGVPTERLLGEN